MKMPDPLESCSAWLLLAHQLPPKPAYFRVKIWRRLQDLGSVAIKASLYALPSNIETREDFQWLLREIQEGGGEATLFEARDADYEALAVLEGFQGGLATDGRAMSFRADVTALRYC
jgi:hypothetical protein